MATLQENILTSARKQPIYWFMLLESAVEEGDHESAVEAYRELRRMGIVVQFGVPDGKAVRDAR